MSTTTLPPPPVSTTPPGPPALDARTPVLFLPVNVETRFMDVAAGGSELWVRVYPDQVAINSHEPGLTTQEISDGQSHWDAVWRAGKGSAAPGAAKAAWRGLASRYGAHRAAWIVLQMTPTNLAQQPAAATPAGSAPAPAPVYPKPPTRAGSWTKPAFADALPDAWTVVAVSGTQTAQFRGGPITPALAVGLTPGAGAFAPGSPVDAGMKWLVDFGAALAAGMALKIPLTPQQRAAGFDRLFVYGLRTRSPAGGGALGALLDAHHYTDGFSLVPQGAPTNNTADASSAYSRKDPDYADSFAVERQAQLNQDPAADGNAFARLAGIDPARLSHVGGAGGTGARNGTDMLTALWPATLGYFLSQMMADVFTPDQIETARQYALANALPRGPVPAFRVGRVPYGVLPVTALRRYKPDNQATGGSVEPALVTFLLRLWPNWLASSAAAPHVDRGGDPDKQLVSVLGMDASSVAFRGRQVLGQQFLWNYMNFIGRPTAEISSWYDQLLLPGRRLLAAYQYPQWDPRVVHLGMGESTFPVALPTVQAGPLSETDPLKADVQYAGQMRNYIGWLRYASVVDLQSENYPGLKPTLLYKILRQSLLLEYAAQAARAEIVAGRLLASQVAEAEIIGAQAPAPVAAHPPVSVWEVLARPSGPNPSLTWAEYLVGLDPPPQSPFARLADLRASLDRLAALPTAELDRLFTESLDACSHRLDVWATAVATAILKRTRAGNVTGVHLGAFGWVEDVRPAAPRPAVQGADLAQVRQLDTLRTRTLKTPAVMPAPLEPHQDNGGFIYAPSLAQAAVAAVLRNGYMTHKGTPDEGLLSVDLSSERVRRALLLLDGVRQGQNLGALLGYLFEAGLHDLGLDKYVQPFRDRFPIVANKLTPSSAPTESVAASNVVDGLALRTAWDNGGLVVGQSWGAGLPGPADQGAVVGLLRTLDDYADALGDLSLAESVFQVIRGNFGRAGGLMDAVSRGANPPTPDVIATPRGGLDLTHRVALLFAGTPSAGAAWGAVTKRPRAAAEPWLDTWLGRMLPDPAAVLCAVRYHDAAGDHAKSVRLRDLDIGPLDCLAMADAAEIPQRGELENRILFAAAVPPGADQVRIDFQPAAPPPGSVSFPDLFFLARSLRALIGSARPLEPQDLTLPEKKAEHAGGAVDLAELRGRAAAAVTALGSDVAALRAAAHGLPGTPAPVRAALVRCSCYGVPGSVPRPGSGPDPGLADQAAAVLNDLQTRLTKASAVALAAAPLSDVLGVFGAVFGSDFVVLPRFTPPDRAALQGAFAGSSALVATDPAAPSRWLLQLTHVRPAISRLDEALTLAQVLGGTAVPAPALLLAQLPAAANDRWLGLPIDPANPPAKGRLALACVAQGDPTTQGSYAGLLVDEWPERIPGTREAAAVAFHYEEPKARAPQALLLAVCPDGRAAWDNDLVSATLAEAFELAKMRTVDLDSVQQVGQILPALYFALNLQGATVSVNFALAKELSGAVAGHR